MIAEYIYELTIKFQAQGIEVSTFLQILRDSQRNCTGNVWWNNCNLKGTKIREDKADWTLPHREFYRVTFPPITQLCSARTLQRSGNWSRLSRNWSRLGQFLADNMLPKGCEGEAWEAIRGRGQGDGWWEAGVRWGQKPSEHSWLDKRWQNAICKVGDFQPLAAGGVLQYGENWQDTFVAAGRSHNTKLEVA